MAASLEKSRLDIGIVPLTDCAAFVVALECGFFLENGLDVDLSMESSWATIRDKVSVGELDAAQMLAGMPIAASLGLAGVPTPMLTALSLDLNGNGITVSRALYLEMRARSGVADGDRLPRDAAALRQVVAARAERGLPKLTFGVVYPVASHNYELRYWMAAAGIDPDRDVNIVVVPPPHMVRHLEAGRIDGYCVGEPWNSLAIRRGIGCTVITNFELWNNNPEKVLGVTEDWARQHPATHAALIRSLVAACAWMDEPRNRDQVAEILSRPEYLGLDVDLVRMPLTGRVRLTPDGEPVDIPDFNVFHRYAANFPWRSHAVWFLTQMLRWGQITDPLDLGEVSRRVYRTDLYRDAVAGLNLACPDIDTKLEGCNASPWRLEAGGASIEMGSDLFFDGGVFDAADPVGYLEQFEIANLKVALPELKKVNGARTESAL